ncbi:MAG: trypsin-like peptidase domain-containing protein [Verrucomicrobia bacterium]|nr:trypsin-like peptidase domain-containing protein [Verrucomicrobiota bacterium]
MHQFTETSKPDRPSGGAKVRPLTGLRAARMAGGLACAIVAVVLCLARDGHAAAQAAEADPRRDATVEAVIRVMPSVVNIATETLVEVRDPFEEMLRDFWGPYYRRRPPMATYSLGSGVIIDEAGYVITNDHVVRRANRVTVTLAQEGGGKEYEAEVIRGTSRSDVALLKLKAEPGEKFTAAVFAADDDLLLGETVLALGNPFGLGGSVSRGILSSKSRRPPVEGTELDIEDWLQTDAAINPGNSGGPLINLRGEVVGLNVAVFREGQGIGFAIPIKRVTAALAEIFSPDLNQLWFGARLRPGAALTVSAVEADSPAAKAGLQPGDVVESINDKTPRGYVDFIEELAGSGDRRAVRLGVRRAGQRQELTVRLVKETTVFNAALIKQRTGLSVQEITRDLAENLGLITRSGLLVAAVESDSPAARAGIQRGHILLGLAGTVPESVVHAAKMLYARAKGETVRVQVLVTTRRGPLIVPRRAEVELTLR